MESENEMTDKMEDAEKYFDCTDRERISFELGIKLGALFHQFIGTPVDGENVDTLEEAIERTTERQAFVRSARVNIDIPESERNEKTAETGSFDYTTLSSDMLDVEVSVEYDELRAVGKMRYIEELDYPLMFIEKIESI